MRPSPAAALVGARPARLGRLLAAVLALVQPALQEREQEDEDREAEDDDEAGVRDDLVAGLAIGAGALVLAGGGERRSGAEQEHPEGEQRGTGHGHENTYPRRPCRSSSPPISPRTWRASPCSAGSRSSWSAATG